MKSSVRHLTTLLSRRLLLEDEAEVRMASEVIKTGGGAAGLTGELSLLIRCISDPCLGRRATTAATMALAPTTAFELECAGCTWIDRVSMGLVGAELLVCSSGFSMVLVTFDLAAVR